MSEIWQWTADNGAFLGVLGGVSLLMFVGSLLLLPVLVSRIPADYFVEKKRHISRLHRLHPVFFALAVVAKNLLGIVLLVSGIAMLVLPGQGILTILVGLMLIDLPGKFAFERRMVSNRRVFMALNWLRARAGRGPLVHPQGTHALNRVDPH